MVRRVILYVIYAGLIVGLLVAIVLEARSTPKPPPQQTAGQSVQKSKPIAEAPTQPSQPKPKTNQPSSSTPPQQSSGQSKTTPPKNNGNAQSTSPTPTAPASPSPAATGTQPLTNSGPGDVVVPFVASVAIGTFGYSRYLKRKLSV